MISAATGGCHPGADRHSALPCGPSGTSQRRPREASGPHCAKPGVGTGRTVHGAAAAGVTPWGWEACAFSRTAASPCTKTHRTHDTRQLLHLPHTLCRQHKLVMQPHAGSSLVLGPWSLVLGPWSLVLGPWSLVLGPWSLVLGAWSLVLGPWCFVLGPWSLVLCPLSFVLLLPPFLPSFLPSLPPFLPSSLPPFLPSARLSHAQHGTCTHRETRVQTEVRSCLLSNVVVDPLFPSSPVSLRSASVRSFR